MKTTANIRFASLAGLLLLSLLALVLAVGLEAAPAMNAVGAGDGGGVTTVGAFAPPAELDAALVRHGQLDRVAAYAAPASTTQTAASGGLSTTTWVILAVVVAMLAIAAWLLLRQRSRPSTAASRSVSVLLAAPRRREVHGRLRGTGRRGRRKGRRQQNRGGGAKRRLRPASSPPASSPPCIADRRRRPDTVPTRRPGRGVAEAGRRHAEARYVLGLRPRDGRAGMARRRRLTRLGQRGRGQHRGPADLRPGQRPVVGRQADQDDGRRARRRPPDGGSGRAAPPWGWAARRQASSLTTCTWWATTAGTSRPIAPPTASSC